ncbi:hypothetical protein QAD02_017238 [Eretmocerus hayati]|uniref:Uncharacterized protein n=1 Tax=Eretmocerus hayati TaxID=131215 RepID=A0ACC2PEK9_9HYME|nr:hypothetical protein QAD02_017238 [Eretmocerus hayati]
MDFQDPRVESFGCHWQERNYFSVLPRGLKRADSWGAHRRAQVRIIDTDLCRSRAIERRREGAEEAASARSDWVMLASDRASLHVEGANKEVIGHILTLGALEDGLLEATRKLLSGVTVAHPEPDEGSGLPAASTSLSVCPSSCSWSRPPADGRPTIELLPVDALPMPPPVPTAAAPAPTTTTTPPPDAAAADDGAVPTTAPLRNIVSVCPVLRHSWILVIQQAPLYHYVPSPGPNNDSTTVATTML